MKPILYIGNKNYSSWSMRPWLILKHFDIEFDEQLVRFDNFTNDSIFKHTILAINPYGTVPVLVDNDITITDSLAICEYLAEKHNDLTLWPKNTKQRAIARNIVAKMHNGYSQIRTHLLMNIEASLPEVGQIILRDHLNVKSEIEFFDQHISSILMQSNGQYLFGDFTIADAFYAPMCLRLKTYQIATSDILNNYINTICQTKAVAKWISDALAEKDFIPFDEPYRFAR
ncbi:glutathione S-transferase N-terminal domain-containing protein [Orbus sturtevantii]|uniref:glutathione S-transferase family protein n=1 Tax=Orbus sturtevantii TaxID=3074109 RepID=UPI00370D178E